MKGLKIGTYFQTMIRSEQSANFIKNSGFADYGNTGCKLLSGRKKIEKIPIILDVEN